MNEQLTISWRGGAPVRAYYEAAKINPQYPARKDTGSPSESALTAGGSLREQARYLDNNHDVCKGALDKLAQVVVGASGIGVLPQPRMLNGDPAESVAVQLANAHRTWARRPEVTWQHNWPSAERLFLRTWLRDGEAFSQKLPGIIPALQHGTEIPYSVELIEPDLLPLAFNDTGIRASIQLNGWNRPTRYWVLKQHPASYYVSIGRRDMKSLAADRMTHLKVISRIGQLRGVSVFASVLRRLGDIKDYDDSERIAAKVAASMAAAIIKGSPDVYNAPSELDSDGRPIPRNMRFRPGMVFDELMPGERIETIDTSRPNPQLAPFRDGQLRMVSRGIGLSNSSLTGAYEGSYSSQRQELVEHYGSYGVMAADFINGFSEPHYMAFAQVLLAAGMLDIPNGFDYSTLLDATYVPPAMPWIDPEKEVDAHIKLEENHYASGPELIMKRGANPDDVVEQETRWRKRLRDAQLLTEADDV